MEVNDTTSTSSRLRYSIEILVELVWFGNSLIDTGTIQRKIKRKIKRKEKCKRRKIKRQEKQTGNLNNDDCVSKWQTNVNAT